MERGKVTLTRRDGRIELSARFVLAANGNLCPCGGWPPETCPPAAGEPLVPCRCSPTARTQYLNRLSGPVLDRIDLVCRLGMPPAGPVSAEPETAAPERLRAAVSRARAELVCRYGGLPGRLEPARLEELLRDRRDWARDRALLEARSLRSRHKILRVALTLAAWDGLVEPGSAHFAEAALYRPERILR
jgi:magnesium chelatase family protein